MGMVFGFRLHTLTNLWGIVREIGFCSSESGRCDPESPHLQTRRVRQRGTPSLAGPRTD